MKKLKVAKLRCTEENRYELLKMAGKICATNTQLKKLTVDGIGTTPEQGYEFLESLVQSDMTELEELILSGEKINREGTIEIHPNEWLLSSHEAGHKEHPVDLLCQFLEKQDELHELKMLHCPMDNQDRKDQIKRACVETCVIYFSTDKGDYFRGTRQV